MQCTGGRFLSAYQIMTVLAVYLMTTAVVDQSPTFMLNHQTRMILSAGGHHVTLCILKSLERACTAWFYATECWHESSANSPKEIFSRA